MSICVSEKTLLLYLDGELTGAFHEHLAAHIPECERCQAKIAARCEIDRLILVAPPAIPAFHLPEAMLEAYLARRLEERAIVTVEDHLADCALCRNLVIRRVREAEEDQATEATPQTRAFGIKRGGGRARRVRRIRR